MVHALASVRAVEDALQIEVPENARIVRDLIAGSQMVQDHVIHFYHLHALDWVDVTQALKADPAKTSQLAQSISDYEKSSATYFKGVQAAREGSGRQRAAQPVRQRLLGPSGLSFAARSQSAGGGALSGSARLAEGFHPHPRRAGRQESAPADVSGGRHVDGHGSQRAVRGHQSGTHRLPAGAGPGGAQVRRTGLYSRRPGGRAASTRIGLRWARAWEISFLTATMRRSTRTTRALFLFPRGIVLGRDLTKVYPVDPAQITESVSHAWYEYSDGDKPQASFRWRNQPEILGAQAALRIPGCRSRSIRG